MNLITPIFPCKSLDELLDFYQTLGFRVTYRQKSPNPYAVIEKGWIRLDFYGIKEHDPKKCYHTCYILTDETDELYETFTEALRKKNGKIPTRGLPRISEIRDKASGIREFLLSDIAGTCIRIGKKITAFPEHGNNTGASKRLSLALDFALKSEGEPDADQKVAAVLDKALERDRNNHCIDLYKVMVIRADMAIAAGETARAKILLEEIRTSVFMITGKEIYKTTWQRVADLEAKLNGNS